MTTPVMNESLRIPPRKNKYAEGEREGEVSVQCVIDITIRAPNGGNKEACATHYRGNLVERRSPGRLTNMTQLGINSFSLDQATKTILSTLRTWVVVFSTKVNRKMLAQKRGELHDSMSHAMSRSQFTWLCICLSAVSKTNECALQGCQIGDFHSMTSA